MSANFRPETLLDIARRGIPLRVACGCGHRAAIDAAVLSRTYLARGWDTRVHMIGNHLRCSRCGRRGARIG